MFRLFLCGYFGYSGLVGGKEKMESPQKNECSGLRYRDFVKHNEIRTSVESGSVRDGSIIGNETQ